eukprot:6886656-Pyramimonas_sp.AAC.1
MVGKHASSYPVFPTPPSRRAWLKRRGWPEKATNHEEAKATKTNKSMTEGPKWGGGAMQTFPFGP